MLPRSPLTTLLALLSCGTLANAFTFSFGRPNECENLNVSWIGGTPPYHLLITPAFGVAFNISIPSQAYSNGQGSYQTQLALARGKQFVLSMGDATGENAGGTSPLLTVGKSLGTTCNSNTTNAAFSFQANTALIQCRTMTFDGYGGAIQPVKILGLIPGGDMIVLNPPVGPTSFDWTADIFAGTSVIFLVVDGKNRQGGTSNLFLAGQSDESDCLSRDTPQSTKNPPSLTATATRSQGASASASPSETVSPSPSDGGTSTGAIIGVILGALLTLAIIASLVLFFIKRRRAKQAWAPSPNRHSRKMGSVDLLQTSEGGHHPNAPGTDAPPSAYRSPYGGPHNYSSSSYDVAGRTTSPFDDPPGSLPENYTPRPYMLSTPTQPRAPSDPEQGSHDHSHEGPTSPRESTALSAMTSTRRNKAAMAGLANYEPASRYIIHTDLEDGPLPNADGVIELPPQYSERRVPAVEEVPPIPSIAQQWSSSGETDPFATAPSSRRPSHMGSQPDGQSELAVPRLPP